MTSFEENDFIYYEINSRECSLGSNDNTKSGTAVKSDFSKEDVVIPGRAGKYKVRTVGYKAFYYKSTIKKITIEEGIKEINHYAFYGLPNMEQIIIPSSVEIINNWAFSGFSGGQTGPGMVTIIIRPESKLKTILKGGFERKETFVVYFCGNTAPTFNDEPFYLSSKKTVYSTNRLVFGGVTSTSDNGFCNILRKQKVSCYTSRKNSFREYLLVFLFTLC